MLQWGRTLSSAERAEERVVAPAKVVRLQWGRTLSSAESQRIGEVITLASHGFNGAALFQVRKVLIC